MLSKARLGWSNLASFEQQQLNRVAQRPHSCGSWLLECMNSQENGINQLATLPVAFVVLQVSMYEGRLALAEKLAKRKKERAAAAAGAAAGATAKAAELMHIPVDDAPFDLDALAAEIDALGSSSSTAAAASAPVSSSSKKSKKQKKQRAKQQQKQQQSAANSREGSDVEEYGVARGSKDTLSAAAAAAAVASAFVDEHVHLLGDVSLRAQHGRAEPGAGSSSNGVKQQQQQRQPARKPQPGQLQHQQASAAAAAGAEGVFNGRIATSCSTPADRHAPAAASAVKQCSNSTAGAISGAQQMQQAADGSTSSSAAAVAAGSSEVLVSEAAAAAAPPALQTWRGSLNPIFMYNRPSSNSSGSGPNSSVAATAAVSILQADIPQNSEPRQHVTLPGIPAVPSAMMAALQQSSSRLVLHQRAEQGTQEQPPASAAAAPDASCTVVATTGRTSAAGVLPGAVASSAAGSSKPPHRKKCMVCMDRLRDVVLRPCKHLVLCSGCAEQMEGRGALDDCPYCRQACSKRVRVHL
jgi:hypothetical protein